MSRNRRPLGHVASRPSMSQDPQNPDYVISCGTVYGLSGENTFSTETIIPVSGCSPVGSTHVNLGPKSLNTDLENDVVKNISIQDTIMDLPKQSTRLSSDEVNTVLVSPVVDL